MATPAGHAATPVRLLLDEMLSDEIAAGLRERGHDVLAVVADAELVGRPDPDILAFATAARRVVVTRNIKDFVVLDARLRADDRAHAGIVAVSTKTFPEDRQAIGALVGALDTLLQNSSVEPSTLVFLRR